MIGRLLAAPLAKIAAGVGLALLVALVFCWVGWSRADNRADTEAAGRKSAEAAVALLQADVALREMADLRREADRQGVRDMERAYEVAISEVEDSAPDAAGLALGCERLRRAGAPGVPLPSICGATGATQADPAR